MPLKRKNETRKHYVSRAIPIIKEEHPEKSMKQVLGQAYGMYDNNYGLRNGTRRKKKRM